MSSWDNSNRYGDNNYGANRNYDNNQYGGRERYTGGNRGGYDRDNYNYRANDYNRDNDYDRGYYGGRGYNDRDNYGSSRGGNYGGNRDYDSYGGNRGGNYSGAVANYGGNRGYDRDYDNNRQLATRNNYDEDEGDYGFGQISRKMRDLERNVFGGGIFGGNNSSLVPYGGGFGGGIFGGGNELASMLGRNQTTPSVVDENGQKQLQWRFNAAGFNPDEVRVSTTGNNQLEVHARHEDRGKHHAQVREFTRIVQLPEGVNAQDVKTRINNQGLLTINVPANDKALEYVHGRELQVSQGGSTANNRGATGQYGTTGQQHTSGTPGSHQQNTTSRTNQ